MSNSQCARLVRAFFIAATKSSDSAEDILPQARTANSRRDNTTYDYNVLLQEDGEHAKLSVFHIFCELFPEIDAIQGFVRKQYINLVSAVTSTFRQPTIKNGDSISTKLDIRSMARSKAVG